MFLKCTLAHYLPAAACVGAPGEQQQRGVVDEVGHAEVGGQRNETIVLDNIALSCM